MIKLLIFVILIIELVNCDRLLEKLIRNAGKRIENEKNLDKKYKHEIIIVSLILITFVSVVTLITILIFGYLLYMNTKKNNKVVSANINYEEDSDNNDDIRKDENEEILYEILY